MKAKVVDQKLDNYGQVVDVVLNKYLGKYTDGIKTYPKVSLSFDAVEEDDVCQEDKELKEYAFRILCVKESTTEEKDDTDKISAEIDYAFSVAKQFQVISKKVLENERENRIREKTATPIVNPIEPVEGDPLPGEGVPPQDTEETVEAQAPSPEIGLSDLISELNND